MSLWYDIKHKNYASDNKSSWIRSYVDKVISAFRGETDSRFNSHFSGTLGRHTASGIDCEDGNTLQQNLENEFAERLASDAAIRNEMLAENASIREEMLAENASIREEITAEISARNTADTSLLTKINQEASARTEALDLKVDKQDGKSLSSNNYTDEEKSKLSAIEANAQVNTVTSVAGKTGAVTLSKSDVGLSEVNNTADFDKPVSIAMQNALDLKMNCSDFMTTYNYKADINDVLTKSNPSIFIPVYDYHPATKKYVDESISFAGGGDMLRTIYDTDNDGVVDNANALGGHASSYYAKASQLSSLASTNHASTSTTYGIGTSSSYGHLKVTDDINVQNTAGTALSVTVGKALTERLDNLTITPTPPALTTICTKGTIAGSNDWTGTGWFYPKANDQYIATDTSYGEVGSDPTGLVRVCLKPADSSSEFWNWTPFYLYNGISYEFFYSPAREAYEALIPDSTSLFSEVLANITWENRPPCELHYGSVSSILGHYHQAANGSTPASDTYFVKGFSSFKNLHFNKFPTKEDYEAALNYMTGMYPEEEISKLDHNARNLLHLMLDVGTNGRLSSSSTWSLLQAKYSGALEYFPIETIDNGYPAL